MGVTKEPQRDASNRGSWGSFFTKTLGISAQTVIMGGACKPGPIGVNDREAIRDGTLCLQRSPTPGSVGSNGGTLGDLETALGLLKAEASGFAYRFINDVAVRRRYVQDTKRVAETILTEVAAGRLTPKDGARAATELRSTMRLAMVGRGLILFSVAVAVYNISTAEDPGRQAVKEGVTAGGGILGGGVFTFAFFGGDHWRLVIRQAPRLGWVLWSARPVKRKGGLLTRRWLDLEYA